MLGVSRTIYVNVDSPNLGFPYFNFLGGYQLKNHLVYTGFNTFVQSVFFTGTPKKLKYGKPRLGKSTST